MANVWDLFMKVCIRSADGCRRGSLGLVGGSVDGRVSSGGGRLFVRVDW